MKTNYYIQEIDNALKNHDSNYPLSIKIRGSVNSSKNIILPIELAKIIKDWYYLNGEKIQ